MQNKILININGGQASPRNAIQTAFVGLDRQAKQEKNNKKLNNIVR